jgi:hypothetical protein
MDYARDLQTGKIVAAGDASRRRSYACPRPGCMGRVYLPNVHKQRPHFRHNPGEGTSECDLYFPGSGERPLYAQPEVAVEEEASELGLIVAQLDGVWTLGLRLPEIPSDEIGAAPLATLRGSYVDVFEGEARIRRVNALELRPGVGTAKVEVPPALQPYRTSATGSWHRSINISRWTLKSRGLDARGTLFRLRRGEWTRLVSQSGVHAGERLLLLSDERCAIPESVSPELLGTITFARIFWKIWEIHIPEGVSENAVRWLAQLGHTVVPKPWAIDFVSIPRSYSEDGDPVWWIGDDILVRAEVPTGHDSVMVSHWSASNSHSAQLAVTNDRFAFGVLRATHIGSSRLGVAGVPSTDIRVEVIAQPDLDELSRMLALTPRLRVTCDQNTLEAWIGRSHLIMTEPRRNPAVRIATGLNKARVQIQVELDGKLRTYRALDSEHAARLTSEMLVSASRIEVDAENLGRIELIPSHSPRLKDKPQTLRRMSWADYVHVFASKAANSSTPALLAIPKDSNSFLVGRLNGQALIRNRINLRQERRFRGTRK